MRAEAPGRGVARRRYRAATARGGRGADRTARTPSRGTGGLGRAGFYFMILRNSSTTVSWSASRGLPG